MHNVYVNYIVEYHDKIERGQIIAGKLIKKIYKILVDGIKSGDWDFDAKKANKAIQFIENFCHHSKGRNDLFKLELWQKAIVSAIFGILDKKTHRRQFREIFLLVGRKNGKSLFAAAIMAYVAYIDGEYAREYLSKVATAGFSFMYLCDPFTTSVFSPSVMIECFASRIVTA